MDGMIETNKYAVCLNASLLNHSCVPNTYTYSIGDVFFFKAVNNLDAGTEITTQYDNCNSFGRQRRSMQDKYDFLCECEYCTKLSPD